MSTTYTLTLATPLTAEELAEGALGIACEHGLLDASASAENLTADGEITTHGTWLKVFGEDLLEDDPVADLGISPGASLYFSYRKTAYETQDDDLAAMVASILKHFAEDAVLHFQYDSIWLMRHGGQLFVNDATEEWTPSRLALLPEPFRHRPLKFPSD